MKEVDNYATFEKVLHLQHTKVYETVIITIYTLVGSQFVQEYIYQSPMIPHHFTKYQQNKSIGNCDI